MNSRPDIEELARSAWGAPTGQHGDELRFGQHGSKSVRLSDEVWCDHEAMTGGGYIDLYQMVNGHRPPKGIAAHRKAAGLPEKPTPEERICWARDLWAATQPATGTRVERYLRSRGITIPVPAALRYVPNLRHQWTDTNWPAMIAAVLDRDGNLVAVHRTWLHHMKAAKAPVTPDKATLGVLKDRGAAIRLARAGPQSIVGEGLETTMSVMQSLGLPGWAAINAGNMANIDLPACVCAVLIAADGDEAGRHWANRAGMRWQRAGLHVRIMHAPNGLDFNDVLQGKVR